MVMIAIHVNMRVTASACKPSGVLSSCGQATCDGSALAEDLALDKSPWPRPGASAMGAWGGAGGAVFLVILASRWHVRRFDQRDGRQPNLM